MVQEIIQEGKMDVCELSGLHSASVAKKSIKRSLYFSLFSYLCVCFVRYRFAHIFYWQDNRHGLRISDSQVKKALLLLLLQSERLWMDSCACEAAYRWALALQRSPLMDSRVAR